MKNRTRNLQNRRGSALIVAVILTAILAVGISSYLTLSNQTVELAHRTYYRNAAFNLAESGIEHAVWTLNQERAGENPWGEWSFSGDDAHLQIGGFQFNPGLSGNIKIYLRDADDGGLEVVSTGFVQRSGSDQETGSRMLHASISPGGGRGLFAFGMLARNHIRASGGVAFDSWISDPNENPDTPHVPYSYAVSRDKVAVATVSTDLGAISLGSSDLYGTVAVGSASEYGVSVGWGGQVGPRNMNEWDPADTTDLWKKDGRLVSTATGAVTTNFTANFEEVFVPEEINPVGRPSYTLPYHRNPNNTYVSKETIGSPGIETVISMDNLLVKAGATLTFAGDVTLVLPQTNVKSLRVIEGGSIKLASGASLTVYTAGNIEISGAGLFNQIAPHQLQIWGTSTNRQEIRFQGSGKMSGVIYAPNADIFLPGGTDFYGAVVANNITMEGSGSFHYDESLKALSGLGGTGGILTVQHIRELATEDDRDPYLNWISQF